MVAWISPVSSALGLKTLRTSMI